MKLGVHIGLGHIVLDGDPAPSTERVTAAPTFEIYGRRICLHLYNAGPMSTVAGHIVLDGDAAPLPPKGHSPQFAWILGFVWSVQNH